MKAERKKNVQTKKRRAYADRLKDWGIEGKNIRQSEPGIVRSPARGALNATIMMMMMVKYQDMM